MQLASPLACLSVLLLLEDFGVPASTCTKLGMEVATLDGLGFLGDDLSLILTPAELLVPRFTLLLCLVGGALDAIKERPNLFSGMEFRAGIWSVRRCFVGRFQLVEMMGIWDGQGRKKKKNEENELMICNKI